MSIINWLRNIFTKSQHMAADGTIMSSFWRIVVTDVLSAGVYDDDEADTMATKMTEVLRRTSTAAVPLQAYVFVHKHTDPESSSEAGVTYHWRETSHYDIHGLVHLQGVSLTENELCQNVLDTIMDKMQHSQYYLDAYRLWSFVQLSEHQYKDMYQDDLDRAL